LRGRRSDNGAVRQLDHTTSTRENVGKSGSRTCCGQATPVIFSQSRAARLTCQDRKSRRRGESRAEFIPFFRASPPPAQPVSSSSPLLRERLRASIRLTALANRLNWEGEANRDAWIIRNVPICPSGQVKIF